jgi:hypothetical protein
LHPVIQEINKITGGCGKGGPRREERRVHLVRKLREQAIHHQLVVLVVTPLLSGLSAEQVMKLRRAPVFFEPTLKRRDFQIPGVPRPLLLCSRDQRVPSPDD